MQDNTVPSADVLLDAPAVAQILGMSTFYVRKHLPVVKLAPRCLKYKMSDVQKFIAARQSKKG